MTLYVVPDEREARLQQLRIDLIDKIDQLICKMDADMDDILEVLEDAANHVVRWNKGEFDEPIFQIHTDGNGDQNE